MILPEAQPAGKLPAVYIIPGFGGDHHIAAACTPANSRMGFGRDLVRIILDPDCGTGHHVFADSATNGPRGKALIEEFIPYLEKTYPLVAEPRARLLNGHSSGGWSSLWLQVTYPDFFGGTWSTSPDPVDFRRFPADRHLRTRREHVTAIREGKQRPIARMGGRARHLLRPVLEAGGSHGARRASSARSRPSSARSAPTASPASSGTWKRASRSRGRHGLGEV